MDTPFTTEENIKANTPGEAIDLGIINPNPMPIIKGGQLATGNKTDYYKFQVSEPSYLDVVVAAPPDLDVWISEDRNNNGKLTSNERIINPNDAIRRFITKVGSVYYIRIKASQEGSLKESIFYSLTIQGLDVVNVNEVRDKQSLEKTTTTSPNPKQHTFGGKALISKSKTLSDGTRVRIEGIVTVFTKFGMLIQDFETPHNGKQSNAIYVKYTRKMNKEIREFKKQQTQSLNESLIDDEEDQNGILGVLKPKYGDKVEVIGRIYTYPKIPKKVRENPNHWMHEKVKVVAVVAESVVLISKYHFGDIKPVDLKLAQDWSYQQTQDYLKSYEGMLVQIPDPIVVAPYKKDGSFVVTSGMSSPLTDAGGCLLTQQAHHPNRIRVKIKQYTDKINFNVPEYNPFQGNFVTERGYHSVIRLLNPLEENNPFYDDYSVVLGTGVITGSLWGTASVGLSLWMATEKALLLASPIITTGNMAYSSAQAKVAANIFLSLVTGYRGASTVIPVAVAANIAAFVTSPVILTTGLIVGGLIATAFIADSMGYEWRGIFAESNSFVPLLEKEEIPQFVTFYGREERKLSAHIATIADYTRENWEFPEENKEIGKKVNGKVKRPEREKFVHLPDINVGDRIMPFWGFVEAEFNYFISTNNRALTKTASGVSAILAEDRQFDYQEGIDIIQYNVMNLGGLSLVRRAFETVDILTNSDAVPDIICLNEIQDDSGPLDDGTVSSSSTLSVLQQRLLENSGRYYHSYFVGVRDNESGGEPGSNIRNAILWTDYALQLISCESVGQDSEEFKQSRPCLHSRFLYKPNNEIVNIFQVHLSSRRGDSAIEKGEASVSEVRREAQLKYIVNYVTYHKAAFNSKDETWLILGDFNEYEFGTPMKVLEEQEFFNLMKWIDNKTRYTYNFDGLSQCIDHAFIQRCTGASAAILHRNTNMANKISDHDPVHVHLPADGLGKDILGGPDSGNITYEHRSIDWRWYQNDINGIRLIHNKRVVDYLGRTLSEINRDIPFSISYDEWLSRWKPWAGDWTWVTDGLDIDSLWT